MPQEGPAQYCNRTALNDDTRIVIDQNSNRRLQICHEAVHDHLPTHGLPNTTEMLSSDTPRKLKTTTWTAKTHTWHHMTPHDTAYRPVTIQDFSNAHRVPMDITKQPWETYGLQHPQSPAHMGYHRIQINCSAAEPRTAIKQYKI